MKNLLLFILLLIGAGNAHAGLTHRYTFSNSVSDVTGSLNGTATTAQTYTEPPQYIANIPAGAVSGSPEKSIRVGMNTETVKSGFIISPSVINQPQGTLVFWVNADKLDGNDYLFFGSPATSCLYVKGAGTEAIQLGAGSSATTAIIMSTGIWHHIAVTWDNDSHNAQIYLNGTLARTLTGYLNDVDPTAFAVGGYNLVNNNVVLANQFKGSLYDLQFYNIVLTGAHLSEMYTLPGSVSRSGDLSLIVHPLFQNHMVLQRDMEVPVWGRALPGAVVTVELDNVVVGTATADESGKWKALLGSHADDGGVSHAMKISSPGEPDILISDVVFGDVYLAAGQSNMAMMINGVVNAEQERAAADYPLIRLTKTELISSTIKQEEPVLEMPWTVCSPSTVNPFTAVGYFFARELYRQTGVPIGLLHSSWGGQRIDRFLCPSGVAAVPELAGLRQDQEQGGVTNLYDIYNAMIAPLIPYGIRGVLWYQGEGNSGDSDLYRLKTHALMRGWRQEWQQGNFPFYYVQLANLTNGAWSAVRDSQRRALSETNSGMAVAIDIGDDDNIHPLNKQDVGYRLAQWALARQYGKDSTYSGPLYSHSEIEGMQMRVFFDHAEGGLLIGHKDGTNVVAERSGALENFEIAGTNKVFLPADAVIDADTVVVSSPSVASPVYVRYLWLDAGESAATNQLYNQAGLPTAPFISYPYCRLDVINGTGSKWALVPGDTPWAIAANPPPSGQVFDRWIGASSELANLNAASTTVTDPSRGLYLLATYCDTNETAYLLTVNSGYGSGTSKTGSVLIVEANAPSTNKIFDHWSGDTQLLAQASAPVTTLRMPANNVSITAVYRTVDSVGDGIADTWRSYYFGGAGTTTNSESSADADPDQDGMTNFEEYKAGTSPNQSDSTLQLKGKFSATTQLSFSSIAGHRYRLETTRALLPPVWEPVVYNIAGDGGWKHAQFNSSSASNAFYRLIILP
jgi:sialate O-acetylesterase